MTSVSDPQLQYILTRGVIDIVPAGAMEKALESGKKLRLKLGLDPSKPDLHIGHAVLLRKLRALQEMGHTVVLIVGDWTAQIGDPSGQSIMRPMLTAAEVKENAETYMRQFFHVVDKERTEVRWQTEWFSDFTLDKVVELTSRFTVAQMLQREDFRQRFEAQQPLGIHELLYPLLQAYDSVAIEADVEFGGSDQLFNMLVGRELQEAIGQEPQIVFTMDLLVGIDGHQKMSKSLGNTIDLEDPPAEKFGKVMSIPDEALLKYLTLATDLPDEEIQFLQKKVEQGGVEALEVKKTLGREIVAMFHGEAAANEAETEFERVFQKQETPEEVEEVSLGELAAHAVDNSQEYNLPKLLHEKGFAPSVAEARRLIKQGAVHVLEGPNKGGVTSPQMELVAGLVLRVGKHRFLKIVEG